MQMNLCISICMFDNHFSAGKETSKAVPAKVNEQEMLKTSESGSCQHTRKGSDLSSASVVKPNNAGGTYRKENLKDIQNAFPRDFKGTENSSTVDNPVKNNSRFGDFYYSLRVPMREPSFSSSSIVNSHEVSRANQRYNLRNVQITSPRDSKTSVNSSNVRNTLTNQSGFGSFHISSGEPNLLYTPSVNSYDISRTNQVHNLKNVQSVYPDDFKTTVNSSTSESTNTNKSGFFSFFKQLWS